MKRATETLLVIALVLLLASCGKTDEEYLAERIVEKIEYLNINEINIYYNGEVNKYLEDVNSLHSFTSLDDVVLENDFTFIGYNVIDATPTSDEIEYMKTLLDQEEKKVSICFYGKDDFDYLNPMGLTNYTNEDTFAYCFGNYFGATVKYKLNIHGFLFEDIFEDEMMYTFSMLNYVEKQSILYFEYIG